MGGFASFNKISTVQMLPVEIYLNPKSISMILSVKDVIYVGKMLFMDTDSFCSMLVLYLGEVFVFKERDVSIFVFDAKDERNKSKFRMIFYRL